MHEYGLAWDMVTEPFSVLPLLGAYWNRAGGRWHASDQIHFSLPLKIPWPTPPPYNP